MLKIPTGVRNLLFLNVGLFLVPELLGRSEIFIEFLGLHFLNSRFFSPLQLVSHLFMHGGFMHLAMNMLGLVVFGAWLERVWGVQRFLLFYFVCGIGAGLLYMAVNYFELEAMLSARDAFLMRPSADDLINFLSKFYSSAERDYLPFIDQYSANPDNLIFKHEAITLVSKLTELRVDAPMIGASGAVFGIILAFGLTFPDAPMLIFPLPFPIKAKWIVLGYGLYALSGAIHKAPGDNVAHYAHLGGMLFGYIMLRVYKKW